MQIFIILVIFLEVSDKIRIFAGLYIINIYNYIIKKNILQTITNNINLKTKRTKTNRKGKQNVEK